MGISSVAHEISPRPRAKFSPSNCLNVLISCTSCAIFVGGKNLVINFSTKSFHEVMESGNCLVNQCLAQSLSDSGNKRNMRASSVTPLYLTMSQTSIKIVICAFGFSLGNL